MEVLKEISDGPFTIQVKSDGIDIFYAVRKNDTWLEEDFHFVVIDKKLFDNPKAALIEIGYDDEGKVVSSWDEFVEYMKSRVEFVSLIPEHETILVVISSE